MWEEDQHNSLQIKLAISPATTEIVSRLYLAAVTLHVSEPEHEILKATNAIYAIFTVE